MFDKAALSVILRDGGVDVQRCGNVWSLQIAGADMPPAWGTTCEKIMWKSKFNPIVLFVSFAKKLSVSAKGFTCFYSNAKKQMVGKHLHG